MINSNFHFKILRKNIPKICLIFKPMIKFANIFSDKYIKSKDKINFFMKH